MVYHALNEFEVETYNISNTLEGCMKMNTIFTNLILVKDLGTRYCLIWVLKNLTINLFVAIFYQL